MNRTDCWCSSRCGKGEGCIVEMANCGFVAKIEVTKKWVKSAFLSVLRRHGVYSCDSKWYMALKKRNLRVITENEFCEAENWAVDKFCTERKEANENFQMDYSRRLNTFLTGLV